MSPWHVRKAGKRWAIVRGKRGKKGSKVVGYSKSKAKAQASVRARYANYKGK